ncbi:origin recognition complex subunit 4 [Alternaria alternata]|nr:origin recognition complex subunit 4 [Alternaria alternata]
MDDSPRSSKRRKLDTSERTEPSPSTKPSTRKASGRLATKSAANTNGDAAQDEVKKPAPVRKGRLTKGATNGTPAKRAAAAEEIDVYDDIEGALNVAASSRPVRARKPTEKASKENTPIAAQSKEEIQTAIPPKRGKGRPTKAEVASRNALKEANDAKGESKDAVTPAKAARKPAASVRKPAAPRASARKKKEPSPIAEEDEEADELQNNTKATKISRPRSIRKPATGTRKKATALESESEEAIGATPSKSVKRRKPVGEQAVIPESADELGDGSPTTNRKLTASERRRFNRTDHIANNDEERWSNAEDQTNGHDEDEMDIDGNSLLDSVLDPTEPSPFNKPTSAQKEKLTPSVIYSNLVPGRELDLLKTIVMDRITGKRPSPLVGLDDEYKSVYQLVEQTIAAGEGNSMLVIGARGSGKTALVNKVLSEVSKDNGGQYHVVRLNGFVHTDDKIALREIWRQLGKEMDIEEDGSGPGKNYADTLATLLALLSHPSEQTGEVTDEVAKAVVFVMDEFDLFAQHPRQTLLYNLFDIAQSRKAPIAVLGLTTRIDVTNSLEKRVKSRFSHRYVHLRLATTFTAFQETCKACLSIQPEQLSVEERGILEGGTKSTPAKKGKKNDTTEDALSQWNANISLSLSLLIAAARLDIIHDSDTCNFNMAYDEYVTLASRARIQSAAGGLSSSSGASKVWGKDVARREWEGLVDLGLIMPVIQGQVGAFGMVRCDVALEEVGEVLKGIKGGDKGLERWCRSI